MTDATTRGSRLLAYWRSAERLLLAVSMITISILVVGNVLSRQIVGNSWAFT